MEKWLPPALDYVEQWIEYQMRQSEQPGCVVAVARHGKLLLVRAFGQADLAAGTPLTARHRFRVASHSKSFTAAGILKLRERGKLHLDDPVGRYVRNLHPAVAQATIAQLLSHSAGIIRDGVDAGQWDERRSFLSARELRAELRTAPVIEGNTRFKYSNHGYGLAGLLIEAVTGEDYGAWMMREIVTPAGLRETEPDAPIDERAPSGHSGKLPVGRRLVIGGWNPTRGLAAATGFVSTARDLLRFFAQLDPEARRSVLSVASRREMIRRQWRDPHASLERYYGLGTISGGSDGWSWFGHSGGFPGFITRTAMLPERGLAICVLTNAIDGPAAPCLDGIVAILRGFAERGAPARAVRDWSGRWWSRWWGAVDLVPMGDKVVVAAPDAGDPFQNAAELAVTGRDRARIAIANGYAHHGEAVMRRRDKHGAVAEIRFAGTRLLPEAAIVAELAARDRSTPPPA